MNAAEAMHFHGAPNAHVVAWEEHRRLAAKREEARQLVRQRERGR